MTEWRTVPGAHRYEVSENGEIRRNGKTLAHLFNGSGYAFVSLRVCGARRTFLINRTVCEAWHGPPPFAGAQAAHGDGNKRNNHRGNLRWATAKENGEDKVRHRTQVRGERSPFAKLTWEAARTIRAECASNRCAVPKLAQRFGVSQPTVLHVLAGRSWREDLA